MLKQTFIAISIIAAFAGHVHGRRPLTKAKSPAPTELAGFERSHCVTLAPRTRVCKCVSESESVMLTEVNGRITNKWPAGVFLMDTSTFEVLTGDLDDDGVEETIVANHNSTSNGMAVSRWSVWVFAGRDLKDARRPLAFDVEEYGTPGTFADEKGRVQILTTEWVWGKDLRGKRGNRLYLTGKWWRYKNGELVPIVGRSPAARRFLASFAEERGRVADDRRTPRRWLTDPRAERRKTDLLIDLRVRKEEEGVVSGVSNSSGEDPSALNISFEASGQKPFEYVYPSPGYDAKGNKLHYVGELSTGVVYPINYTPAQPEKWLTKRRAQLVTYDDGLGNEGIRVLWLR